MIRVAKRSIVVARRQRGFIINPYAFGGAAAPFLVDAADFTAAPYIRSGALTGQANSATGILSYWMILDAAFSNWFSAAATSFGQVHGSSSVPGTPPAWQFSLTNTALTASALNLSSAHLSGLGAWNHILLSWDLSTSTALLYINDALDTFHSATFGATSAHWSTLDSYTFGADWTNGGLLDGGLAEVYLAPGQFLDFSVTANRRKFISATAKPVDLGADGSTPTGTKPLVYLHLDNGQAASNFATNRAGNGNFSITGTLTTRATSPSD